MLSNDQIDLSTPVLLVEDEALIATDIELMLRGMGFETVFVCLTHRAAKDQVAEGGFGLAIFDINVGGMLSHGLISTVIGQGCPVVTISGYITGSDIDAGRVFLSKPIDSKRLEHAILEAHRLCRMPKAG